MEEVRDDQDESLSDVLGNFNKSLTTTVWLPRWRPWNVPSKVGANRNLPLRGQGCQETKETSYKAHGGR